MVEQLAPEILEYAGIADWWKEHRNHDAQIEGEIIVNRLIGFSDFEEKCKVLRKLTQKEREIIGYGRFPLRIEDFDGMVS